MLKHAAALATLFVVKFWLVQVNIFHFQINIHGGDVAGKK